MKRISILVFILVVFVGCKQATVDNPETSIGPEGEDKPTIPSSVIPLSSIGINDIKPNLQDIDGSAVTGKGWGIDSGTPLLGTRYVTVPEGTAASDISNKILEKLIIEHVTVSSEVVNVVTQESVIATFTLLAEDGYVFSDNTKSKKLSIDYALLFGEFKVETVEDFQSVLDAIPNNQNDEKSVIVDLSESLVQSNDSNTTFEIEGGKKLTLKSSNEEGIELNGGDVITSLVVKGSGTVVTVGEGITITGGKGSDAAGVLVDDGAHFILNGGIIANNNTSTNTGNTTGGGGVSVLNGTFTMMAGTETSPSIIKNNKGRVGGGVFVNSIGSTFIMKGGIIEENTATDHGGAVYSINGGNIRIEGGVINNNKASNLGGAITAVGGTNDGNTEIVITGGLIENNTAKHGAVVISDRDSNLHMSGGTISNNVATAAIDDHIQGNKGGLTGIVSAYGANINNVVWTGGTINGLKHDEISE